jgi:hypothetical protein
MTNFGLFNLLKIQTAQKKRQYFSKNSNKFRRYNFLFLKLTSIVLLGVGLFNWAIDPYGVFNSPQFSGLNQAKPEKLNNMRLFKAADVTRIKPVTIFLGSSRTEYGLNPNHPALNNKQPAYNLALGAATPYELLRYLKHAIANQPNLKLAIIGIDEFMFNELNKESSDFSEQRLEKQHLTIQDAINTSLSLDALIASKKTISLSQKYPKYYSYTPKGSLNPRLIDRDPSATNYRFTKSIGFYFQVFPQYELSYKYLKEFEKIINLCQQKGIETKVFISPAHATRWEAIHTAEHWSMFEQMKREIVKITPVWDFSGYNTITTELIKNDINNYIDDSHYRQEVGDLILNRILSYKDKKVPNDFGILLTPNNIEVHLTRIRAEREIWAKNNPDEVELVKKLKLNLESQNPK